MLKFPDRIKKLRELLDKNGYNSILISNDYNRRYLSGFTGSAGFLLITNNKSLLFTDFRYTEQASLQATGFEVIRIQNPTNWLSENIKTLDISSIAFESDDLTVNSLEKIKQEIKQSKLKISLESTVGLISNIREIKSNNELTILKKTIEISDQAFEAVSENIRPGISEQNIAWEFEKKVRELGGEAISFDTIVASGPNAARPHHKASENLIKKGETIVFDCGARYKGYCSDLTRTIILGTPDNFTRKIYEIVLAAQETAIALIESGMTGNDCDAISRSIINKAGYEENFGHSLGHGVGLEVHELPFLGNKSQNIIEDEMVFTIEPGIYIEGWGGVRIEDIVVMKNGKPKILSNATKIRY